MGSKTGRNDPCPCGSGKKYKKCCLSGATSTDAPTPPPVSVHRQPSLAEPYLDLMPSFVWKGQRWRVVCNRLHYRREDETFHEFLMEMVKLTLGEEWWKHQIAMEPGCRHAVVEWIFEYAEWRRRNTDDDHRLSDGIYEGDAPGVAWAIMSLGYDLFCLQDKRMLPDFLIEKLRKRGTFQSARYEVAAAAIMARAGFTIEFLDEKEKAKKHCEFIAAHRVTGRQVGVEAKSRVRPGAIHSPGEFRHTEDYKGLEKLVKKAGRQKPEGLPYIVFLDVNFPPTAGIPNAEKPWLQDVTRMIERRGVNSPENRDEFNALFVTNFSHYYGYPDGKCYPGEWVMIMGMFSETPMPEDILKVIYDAVQRYDRIPDEV